MRRFKRFSACVAIAAMASIMLATTSFAKSDDKNTEIITEVAEEQTHVATETEQTESSKIDEFLYGKNSKKYRDKYIISDVNKIEDEGLRTVLGKYIDSKYTLVVDIHAYSLLFDEQPVYRGMTIDNGAIILDGENNVLRLVNKCSSSQFDFIKGHLSNKYWYALDKYELATFEDAGEPYFHLNYSPEHEVVTFTTTVSVK